MIGFFLNSCGIWIFCMKNANFLRKVFEQIQGHRARDYLGYDVYKRLALFSLFFPNTGWTVVTKSFLGNCQILLLVSHGIYPSVKNYSLRWKVTEKKEKFTHQVKACQQVWASTVRSFEIAFKSSPKSFKSGSIKYTQVKFVLRMHR